METKINTVGQLKRALQPFEDNVSVGIREENSKVVRSINLSLSVEDLFDRFYVVLKVEDGAKEVGEI